MSQTANWSYTNTARIRPRLGMNMRTGQTEYGEEYEIACTWSAVSEQSRDEEGAEFISRNEIYTEDARPRYLDMILLNGDDPATGWQQIRARAGCDMSFFGEAPDYQLVT